MRNDVCYNPTIKLRKYAKTILDVNDMKNLVIEIEEDGYVKEYAIDFKKFLKDYGIKNKPVLDADGVLINVGDTVYDNDGVAFHVDDLNGIGITIKLTCIKSGVDFSLNPVTLTHKQPDNLELIHEDEQLLLDKGVYSYCDKYDLPYGSVTVRDIAIDHISKRYREVLERKFKN